MINFFSRTSQRNHRKQLSLLTGVVLLCVQQNVWADKPVEKVFIDADNMQLNMETGKSVYTGNVKISQGELVLTGDKVTLEQKNNEIQRITVVGKPARYNHVMENGEHIQAESEKMVYTASQNKLVMTVNARLQQPDNLVSSQKITYDTLKKIIIAGDNNSSRSNKDSAGNKNGSTEKQRVNITLTPKKQIQPSDRSPAKKTPGDN